MAQSNVRSRLRSNRSSGPSHAQRLEEWRKRMAKFAENTYKLESYLNTRLQITQLGKNNQSLEDHGYAPDDTEDQDCGLRDSVTSGNTPYCKLIRFKYTPLKPRKSGVKGPIPVLARQYWFFPTMSDSMKYAIGEGARMQSFFSRSRLKDSHLFLEIYGVYYESADEGPKLFYVVHDPLPPSSVALRLWNFENNGNQSADCALDLARAAEWLNLNGVTHRFIRPENVLLLNEKHIRLSGFDMACRFYKVSQRGGEYLQQPTGLPVEIPRQLWDHLPPECFGKSYDPQLVDSWSIGVLLCTLLTGSHPFDIQHPESMLQQWKTSSERAAVPYVASDDPLRTLLDDIFQPMDQRMTTFDILRDRRLHNPATTMRTMVPPYYRIDMNRKQPTLESGATLAPASLDTRKFSEMSVKIFEQESAEFIEEIASEEAIGRRKNGNCYQVMRNESFGKQCDIFSNEVFLAAASLDEQGNRKGAFLVKIFMLQHLSKGYRSILLMESTKIMRFLGSNNTPSLLRVTDIFLTKGQTAKMYIFYANELLDAKSLRKLAGQRFFMQMSTVYDVMYQLAYTVALFSHLGVSHRYLRPEHIFLTLQGAIKVTALEMLCFSWNPKDKMQVFRSRGLHDDQEQQWDHLPPECFLSRYDSQLLDVWSFGVVLVYCLTLQCPFKVPHTIEEATEAWDRFRTREEYAPTIAPYLELLKRIFQPAEKRISSSELKQEVKKKRDASRANGASQLRFSLNPERTPNSTSPMPRQD